MLPAPTLSSQLEKQVGPVKMEGEMQGEPRNGCSLEFFLPRSSPGLVRGGSLAVGSEETGVRVQCLPEWRFCHLSRCSRGRMRQFCI